MSYLCRFLLLFSVVIFSTSAIGMFPEKEGAGIAKKNSSAAAAAARASSSDDDDNSPQRQIAATSADATPGQRLSQVQAQFFVRGSFTKVIEEKVVDSWGINWGAFAHVDASPNDAQKRSNIRLLNNRMKELSRTRTDSPFRELRGKVLEIKDDLEDVHLQRLEEVVGAYFSSRFSGSRVEFEPKGGGVQLGAVATVHLLGNGARKFYIKTHSEGKLNSNSSAAKVVNPRELLVYKALERLGVGCESHFCARSLEDVYIATVDAEEAGDFFLFKKAVDDQDELGRALWGELGALQASSTATDLEAIEARLTSDSIERRFAIHISMLDVLSRIFRLQDLLKNSENFGFLTQSSSLFVPRILDFRVGGDDEKFQLDDDRFGGFLEGNGLFDYTAAHKTVCYVLRERAQKERVRTALFILTAGPLQRLPGAISQAYEDVVGTLHSDVFRETQEKLLRDLTTYREILLHNFAFFKRSLESKLASY